MKYCSKCGQENEDDVVFCKTCGTKISNVCPKEEPKQRQQDSNKYYPFFVNLYERAISEIGSNYIQNFLTIGQIEEGFEVITQKRLYFKGKDYSLTNGKLSKYSRECIIDLQDITGTGYTNIRKLYLLILAILFCVSTFIILYFMTANSNNYYLYPNEALIFGILCTLAGSIISFILYFTNRITLFDIFFAGGQISMKINCIPESDIENFQRQLRLLKDSKIITDNENVNAHLVSLLKNHTLHDW